MSKTDHLHTTGSNASIRYRVPCAQDGLAVWRAVEQAGTLEVNTAYFYLIFCSDFRDTCLIAQDGKEIAGVLIGYHPPNTADTAFCWQIGVLPAWQGQGLATQMLLAWLDLPSNRHVRWVTATVADDNVASAKLFQGFARMFGVSCKVTPHFTSDHFPVGHRPEPLYRIGPISPTGPIHSTHHCNKYRN